MWAHKTWWDSESPAGLRKDGSWGKLLGAGPDPGETGRGTDLDQLSGWLSSQRPVLCRSNSRELLGPESS